MQKQAHYNASLAIKQHYSEWYYIVSDITTCIRDKKSRKSN